MLFSVILFEELNVILADLDAGDLGGEGEVCPALDGDAPLLLEAVPLHLDLDQLLRHLDNQDITDHFGGSETRRWSHESECQVIL